MAALWRIPYLFAVAKTVSVSYMVGSNNHVAVIVFSVGAIVFALLTRGVLAEVVSTQNERMRRADLLAGLAVVITACVLRHHHAQLPRNEASYAVDRLQMMASGLRPYIDFEFIYGPFHLWAPMLVARVFRTSVVTGFYVWWFTQWIIGTAMLWVTVALLPYCLSRRRMVFWVALTYLLFAILDEGTAYTPTRLIGAAFCILAIHRLWEQTQRDWVLVTGGALSVLLGVGISPEQGLAVACGLVGWLALRAWTERSRQAVRLAVNMALVTSLCLLPFVWLGVFRTLREFAGGAYSFPVIVLGAPPILLLAYVAAACGAVLALQSQRADEPAVPLMLSGFATLPAAMGRADLGHLMLGSGAFLLGVAYLEARPALRRWWRPLVIAALLVVPGLRTLRLVLRPARYMGPPAFWYVGLQNGTRVAPLAATLPIEAAVPHPPCVTVLRAVTVRPRYDLTPAEQCLDTGYFAGMQDVLTPAAIERKAAEITREPLQPLLLRDLPLADEFHAVEINPTLLRNLVDALSTPEPRNEPLNYDAIINAIERNYTPGPALPGGFRVWLPKR